jgi:hypothetical protein
MTFEIFIPDVVAVPTREDKPHRRLVLRVTIEEEAPGVVELTARDGDREVLYIELPVRYMRQICAAAALLERDMTCET